MYRHLMVPVDDSVLSAANVDAAVRLAGRLDARITFFYAATELPAEGGSSMLSTLSPASEFAEADPGAANALLAKARAGALAAGVPCEAVARFCESPATVIVDTALARGCDLIVMASRGRRGVAGWLHSSQTERVLRQCPVALLVTRVAANDPLTPSERATAVIRDEHRSIAVVVRGMRDLVREAELAGTAPDARSLGAMLAYLRAFPLQLHHPKEELYLHRWLRERAPECEPLLRDLEAQHVREHALVDQVVASLRDATAGDAAAVAELGALVRSLGDAVWHHISFEERTVLPLALQHFHAADWTEIAAAFESNDDPGFGALQTEEFRRLFSRIANLTPVARVTG
jgi:nucleotide-binding universal stress UspA family protein/hemerythrin-like domain-containing protein